MINEADPYRSPEQTDQVDDPEHLSLTHILLLILTFCFMLFMLVLAGVIGMLVM